MLFWACCIYCNSILDLKNPLPCRDLNPQPSCYQSIISWGLYYNPSTCNHLAIAYSWCMLTRLMRASLTSLRTDHRTYTPDIVNIDNITFLFREYSTFLRSPKQDLNHPRQMTLIMKKALFRPSYHGLSVFWTFSYIFHFSSFLDFFCTRPSLGLLPVLGRTVLGPLWRWYSRLHLPSPALRL